MTALNADVKPPCAEACEVQALGCLNIRGCDAMPRVSRSGQKHRRLSQRLVVMLQWRHHLDGIREKEEVGWMVLKREEGDCGVPGERR